MRNDGPKEVEFLRALAMPQRYSAEFSGMEFLEQVFLGNPLREWGIAMLWALGGVVFGKLLYRWFSRRMRQLAEKTASELDDLIVDKVEEPLALAVILLGFWFGYDHLHFGPDVDQFMEHVFSIAVALDVTWMAARLLDSLLGNMLITAGEKSDSVMMSQMAPILRKTLRSTVWVLGVIMAMNNAGYDVGALLAGVGIGGLAMGLAAKDFVANIFGGITVFVDKPFVVGDRVQLDGVDGTVVEIGIRSTRIKTLAGRIVTIPNHKFTDSVVENVTAEPARKIRIDLGLTYDTTPERIEEAINMLREIVEKHNGTEDNTTIWFSGFGDFSLNVSVIYYVRKEADVSLTPGAVNLEILRRFNEAGLEFAFPTQTVIHQGSTEVAG
jgi:MscS family membrane protein